jgi:competence protein ComEC
MGHRDTFSRRVVLSVVALLVLSGFAGCLGAIDPGGDSATPDASSPGTTAALDVATDSTSAGGNLSIHFIHVGQGTSILVVGPSGETLLYDTGNWNDDGEHVLDYLRAHDISRIDYLVTSHVDADHIGGHAEVIDYYEAEADGVGAIYDPGIASASQTYEDYLDAVERHNVTLYRAQAGDGIPMEGVSARVLAPPEGYFDGRDRNENSLVLRVAHGNVSALLTGDAGRGAERYLTDAAKADLNATVLAAGHHGSNTSTGPRFLGEVTPRVTVIQSAYDSPYGHPHREPLERLADHGVTTYWTGVHGSVTLETDGERVVVRTQRDGPTDPLELRSAPGISPGAGDQLERRASFVAGAHSEIDSSGTVVADGASETVATDSASETVATDGGQEPSRAADALAVAEVHADARGDEYENLNDEYIVFRNAGDQSIELSGWTVSDEADHRYTFPAGTTLPPGETLTLRTGRGTDGGGDYYWNSEQPIWNNAGDTVFVRTDEGTLVLEVEYDG